MAMAHSPRRIFIASAATMWLAMGIAASVTVVWIRARLGLDAAPGRIAASLAADALLFGALGMALLRAARRWHADRHGARSIALRLIAGALLFMGLLVAFFGAMLGLGGSLAGPLGAYVTGPLFLDHLMYWMIAATVVPLPWLGDAPDVQPVHESMLAIRSAGRVEAVRISAISHAIAADNYVELHGEGRVLLHRATLAGLERALAAHGFVRIGRSALVNLAYVDTLARNGGRHWSLRLRDGAALPVSRPYRQALLAALEASSPRRSAASPLCG
jgi:hypothetical protein